MYNVCTHLLSAMYVSKFSPLPAICREANLTTKMYTLQNKPAMNAYVELFTFQMRPIQRKSYIFA